jgi:predicted Fe-Mo cluster-binding NifX family protein
MNAGIDLRMLVKNSVDSIIIQKISHNECGTLSRDLLDLIKNYGLTVGKVIDNDNVLSRFEKFNYGMRTYKACAACYKN